MALYENGKRISGIRDFPAYTWDEYHALPVAKRPKVWKCTDRDYSTVKNGSTRVTVINDTVGNSYNSQTVTMTKDGYIFMEGSQTSSDPFCGFWANVNGLTVLGIKQDYAAGSVPKKIFYFAFPVRKGDVVEFITNHTIAKGGYVECE